MIRLIIVVSVFTLIGFILGMLFSPSDTLTIQEYGLGSGILHGLIWWGSFIAKIAGQNKSVMALNCTAAYVIGFYISAVISSIISFIYFLLALMLD